ncbi:hypothetical protein PR202_gb02844 [Eleusine coracana subsp. coracana]|uniref:Epidermal patterning factor-like protein n=1 Tax=Eleusine coracana subsp. coracana TaxID=191504 RepID=A0AAV5DXV8_ELECO|nr:hypothetical protein QOZ80_8BG0663990 [Eleusine coracana subsp. coracana]GJN15899.1 hypothetical protein PR202_gb02844 [Eleusine coracana subsp. coracana]
MRPAAAAAPRQLKVAVFLVAFLGLLLQAACLPRLHAPPLSFLQKQQGGGSAWEEEKVRLGSSPPSCRGKCYECSPCTAVQVPTTSSSTAPSTARLRGRAAAVPLVAALSNYKPVGWKCQCRDRVYVP